MLSWGNATEGQLGLGGIEESFICKPRWNKHVGCRGIHHMGCGLKHTVILLESGEVLSCGSNEKGQLGQEERATRPGPIESLRFYGVCQVCCGDQHSMTLDVSGKVYTWGDSTHGQLGLGDDANQVTPQIVKGLNDSTIVQITCGGNHCMALAQDGRLFSWGLNTNHQLGLEMNQPSISTPQCISTLGSIPIAQVCAGRGHSVVVTRGGAVFSWGRNNFGQLGLGDVRECRSPRQMCLNLVKDGVRYGSCGDEHTVLLTENGCVLTCGSSSYGQLGHGSTANCDTATLVQGLEGKEVCQVMCGRMHTIVVEVGSGRVFSFGLSSNGQLGSGERKNYLEPTEVDLGDPPTSPGGDGGTLGDPPTSPGGDGGTSVDPEKAECKVKSNYELLRVFAGGDQSFASVKIVEENAQVTDYNKEVKDGDKTTPNSTPYSDDRSLEDIRTLVHTRMPYFLDKGLVERLDLDRMTHIDMEECIRVLEIIFSSPACLNGSLILEGHHCTNEKHDVDVADALGIFTMIRERLRPEDMESTRRFIFDMIMQVPMDSHACDSNLERKLISDLLPAIPLRPRSVEALRVFYMLPAYMLSPPRKDLIHIYIKTLLDLDKESIVTIVKWFFNGSIDYINLFIVIARKILYKPFLSMKDEDPEEHIKKDQDFLKLVLQFFKLLYEMNLQRNEPIKYEQWPYEYLTIIVNLEQDYKEWIEKKPGATVMCEYAFLLDAKAKAFLMQLECRITMRSAVGEAYRQNILGFLSGRDISDMSPDNFVLVVDRKNIVDSTIVQLLHADKENFKKPLQIQFIGEEGKDEGGVAKEFFMLLCQQILNPDFGMFVEDEESHLMWFRDGETIFYERLDYYIIIGILCGLIIYNSITVYLPFPIILYKRLLGRPPCFSDFKELFPVIGRSLQFLIDYNGDDFEEHFGLNHTINRQVFGEVKVRDLVKNGSKIPVTKDNRNQYIYEYMKYIIITSIEEQFNAFEKGFLRVCGGRVLGLLHPRDLMSLVVGKQVHDWTEFKKYTRYRNGYSVEDEAVVMFWEIFSSFSQEDKDKFLVFLTGTNRIPIKGFEGMGVIIQRMDGGDDFEKLPVAHTCFNVLDLPPYPNKEKMKQKLYQAITLTSGFGII